MATMVTVTMVCVAQERVGATKASEEKPASCVSLVTTAPTAQVDLNRKHTARLFEQQHSNI